jgi:hypothetical protein
MIDEDYISNSNSISKIIKDDNVYITFNTDFEKMSVIYKGDNLFASIGNLIRFIDTEYYDFYRDNKLHAAYFLPSHIETKLQECLAGEGKTLDSICNAYLPDCMRIEDSAGGNDKIDNIYDTIKSSMRASYSTSFFFCDKQDKDSILEGIRKLKREIISIKDYDVAIGYIENGCGIIEKSKKNKTDNPETIHCSFWKFNNDKTFVDIADKFKKILG